MLFFFFSAARVHMIGKKKKEKRRTQRSTRDADADAGRMHAPAKVFHVDVDVVQPERFER